MCKVARTVALATSASVGADIGEKAHSHDGDAFVKTAAWAPKCASHTPVSITTG
jgi:hypothetical protein